MQEMQEQQLLSLLRDLHGSPHQRNRWLRHRYFLVSLRMLGTTSVRHPQKMHKQNDIAKLDGVAFVNVLTICLLCAFWTAKQQRPSEPRVKGRQQRRQQRVHAGQGRPRRSP